MRPVVIRCAVWGDVDLDPLLVEVLGTPELQRLRRIRQLGTANLVYPSANHTRFEHVLGTCHVAGRMLENLAVHDPELVRLARTAALVHDVGHVPFGHTFEDERRIFPRHDGPERTRHFLGPGSELGRLLAREGLAAPLLACFGAGEEPPAPLVQDVVAGTVCADLLDYLARDAVFTGIRRSYDERLFRYFARSDDGRLVLRLSKGGLRREDAFSEVIHLLRLRYTLTERVYFHHAKVTSGALISKSVERAVARGLTLEELYPLGDEGLLVHLEARYAPQDPVLARLLADLARRRLPKRAYVLTRRGAGDELQARLIARFHTDRAERERVEAELEQELGLDPGDVILYCPSRGMAEKEASVLVDVGGAAPVPLGSLALREVSDLLEKHRDLWKFYALVSARRGDARERLAAACAARFGAPSELLRG
ncbi:MAG: HD domain-containing protein [Planctomycetota bacterium]